MTKRLLRHRKSVNPYRAHGAVFGVGDPVFARGVLETIIGLAPAAHAVRMALPEDSDDESWTRTPRPRLARELTAPLGHPWSRG
jgi:hypothetical protein